MSNPKPIHLREQYRPATPIQRQPRRELARVRFPAATSLARDPRRIIPHALRIPHPLRRQLLPARRSANRRASECQEDCTQAQPHSRLAPRSAARVATQPQEPCWEIQRQLALLGRGNTAVCVERGRTYWSWSGCMWQIVIPMVVVPRSSRPPSVPLWNLMVHSPTPRVVLHKACMASILG